MRKYTYNAERDRLDSLAWNPFYRKVTYEDILTHKTRDLVCCVCSSNPKQISTVAMRYALSTENIKSIEAMRVGITANWLLNGKDALSYKGLEIPAEFVLKYVVSKKDRKGGNLDGAKYAIKKGEEKILNEIAASYELTLPEHDIVRTVGEEKDTQYTQAQSIFAKKAATETEVQEEMNREEQEQEQDEMDDFEER